MIVRQSERFLVSHTDSETEVFHPKCFRIYKNWILFYYETLTRWKISVINWFGSGPSGLSNETALLKGNCIYSINLRTLCWKLLFKSAVASYQNRYYLGQSKPSSSVSLILINSIRRENNLINEMTYPMIFLILTLSIIA